MNDLSIVATTEFKGGAEKYVAALACALQNSNTNVRLIGDLKTWPESLPNHTLAAGRKWSLKTLPLGFLRIAGEIARLRVVLKRHPSGVYNSHFKREQIAYTKELSRVGRVVWTEHGRFPAGPFGFLIRPLYRCASRSVSAVVCVSEIVARDIRKIVVNPEVVRVIDTAVDVNSYQVPSTGARKRFRAGLGLDGRPVVVYVGRLEPSKRPELVIKAALEANYQVLVAGTGSEEGRLLDAYKERADVHFLGQIEDVRSVFAAGDVHIFSSTGAGEGFPTVILEASAMGIPTIAAEEAGFGYAVLAAGGAEFDGTLNSLITAVRDVLSDASSRGKVARQWAESRDQRVWVQEYLDVFFPSDETVDSSTRSG